MEAVVFSSLCSGHADHPACYRRLCAVSEKSKRDGFVVVLSGCAASRYHRSGDRIADAISYDCTKFISQREVCFRDGYRMVISSTSFKRIPSFSLSSLQCGHTLFTLVSYQCPLLHRLIIFPSFSFRRPSLQDVICLLQILRSPSSCPYWFLFRLPV